MFTNASQLTTHRPKTLGRWIYPLLIGATALLSGCASTTSETTTAQFGAQQNRLSLNNAANDAIDPITLILASQHPISRQALQQIGVKYRYGGSSPNKGFDCSGLVFYSTNEAFGLKLPRRAAEIARSGQNISRNDLTAGDLVFFNTLGARFSHVGIYLGSDLFVHAPSSGGAVRVENMTKPYWKKRFTGARRIEPVTIATR